jgi:uncharacterized protein (TIGR02588 family)
MSDKVERSQTPMFEWVAAAIGLALIFALVVVIGRGALREREAEPPSIEIKLGAIRQSASGYMVAFQAINRANGTAAALTVEGTVARGKQIIERSQTMIDYVPGHGRASGGLFFSHDPRHYALSARATGFQDP